MQAMGALQWFARGGSLLNYYMFAGGSNLGRWTGDSVRRPGRVGGVR
jgi:hypothetical protein